MMASRPSKKYLSSDLENGGQGHHLQKSLYLSYFKTDFYQTFIEMMAPVASNKYVISADLENIGQGVSQF